MGHEPRQQPGQGGEHPLSLRLAAAILNFGVPGTLMLGAGGPRGCSEFWRPRRGCLEREAGPGADMAAPGVCLVHHQWDRGMSRPCGSDAFSSSDVPLRGTEQGREKCSGAPQSCFQIPPVSLPGWGLENKAFKHSDLSFSSRGLKPL